MSHTFITIPITSGITNTVSKIIDSSDPSKRFIYKEYDSLTPDHDEEIKKILEITSDPKSIGLICVDILSYSQTSRMERFIEGYSLTAEYILSNKNYLKYIAFKMSKFHQLQPKNAKGQSIFVNIKSFMFDIQNTVARKMILDYLALVQKYANITYNSLVFCHNDLLPGNIMQIRSPYLIDHESNICFIDLEYSGYNYRGYDIANFLNELNIPFGKNKAMNTFIKYYLVGNSIKPKSENKKKLANEILLFRPLSYLYWGLWGLDQLKQEKRKNVQKFDYKGYSFDKLKLFSNMTGLPFSKLIPLFV